MSGEGFAALARAAAEAVRSGDADSAEESIARMVRSYRRDTAALRNAVATLLPWDFKRFATYYRVSSRELDSVDPLTGLPSYKATTARLLAWTGPGAKGSFVVDSKGTRSTMHDALTGLGFALQEGATDCKFKMSEYSTTSTGRCEPPAGYVQGVVEP